MLRDLDCLLVDLQDVGTRVYTFIWSLSCSLQACAAADLPVVILDRPNPLGGEVIEGPKLEAGFESFVGRAQIPMRHGLTLGEMGLFLQSELRLGGSVEVVRMDGWRRRMLFPETGRNWMPPSPNMPRFETALFYPGQVLLEGTNLSEGRGTTAPFELCGAPFVDPYRLARELASDLQSSLESRPVRFRPTFDKWSGQSCGGVRFHAFDPHAARPFRMTLAVLDAVMRQWPDEFQWLPPPYEYEHDKMPIDILFGAPRLRNGLGVVPVDELAAVDASAWLQQTSQFRLYD
jgi:uncharacterized protein YbbC (DUF1343 family)